ncbi:MAG: hypothetical protein ACP5O4_00930 [bacterium]
MKKIDYFYLWIINIFLFIISINSGSLFTYLIFILLTLVLILAYIYPEFSLKNLRIIELSSDTLDVFKNGEFNIKISLYNNSIFPVFF